ncbi:cysteine hydrolase family protein [Halomonas binhaiensis]|uniref:Cysteine hydrolase n=1 Tax=Halomonas binhaiensis TaxID=2562282 RepID=A0A5C1NA08_9GAMM|nr:cysteine hydrolase family protein [Halomonas binhaiensis]QEM80236.1 cysteine hydrolase [Halomonas binhaiensis]
MMSGKKALLVMDFINEIVHPEGVYACEGYYQQTQERGVLKNVASALKHAREQQLLIIFIVVGFNEHYEEFPPHSRVFAPARAHSVLKLDTWSTQVHEDLKPLDDEIIIAKSRVSPFYQTNLELVLRTQGIEELILTGVSTEHVVLATTLEGHDRDFIVTVLEDACSAVTQERHLAAMERISLTANIRSTAHFVTSSL